MSKRKAIPFDRWSSHLGNTLACRVFMTYQVQVGQLLQALTNSQVFSYRYLSDTGFDWGDDLPYLPGASTSKIRYDSRLPPVLQWPVSSRRTGKRSGILTVREWSDSQKDAMNWARLNSIVTIIGNFEMYMSKIATLTFKSDLGLLVGTQKRIDGALSLKYPKPTSQPIGPLVESFTKGEWPARVSAYEKSFGAVPSEVKQSVGRLEKLRRLRNNIAHAFARDIDEARDPEMITLNAMIRMSPGVLAKRMKMLSDCAIAIDRHLLADHIGEYELIYLYHQVRPTFPSDAATGEKGRRFKQDCGKRGHMINVRFAKELARYYEAL